MKDMKDLGGTAAQKKIAQDRQRAREAKNKGFDPKKEVLKDKPGSLTKKDSSELRKPELRKSQLGKWSQGIKNSPGNLAKKSGGALAKKTGAIVKRDDIENVNVKDEGPTTQDEKQAGDRPGTTRSTTTPEKKQDGEKKKMNLGKHLKKLGGKLKDAALKDNPEGVGVSGEGSHSGVQQRNKGLAS